MHRSIPRRRSLRANRHASPFSPYRFFWALCSLFRFSLPMTRRAPSTSEWLLMFPRLLHAPSVLPSVSSSPLTRSHVPSAVSCIEIGGILGTLWCGGPLFSPSRLGYVSDAYHLSRAHICEAASILAGIVFAALPWASSPLAFLLLCLLLGFFLYNGKLLCFFALWVVGYACMGTLWPILCIVFKQWLPDNCTLSSSY